MHAYIHVCIHVPSSALFLFVNYNDTLETQYFRIVGHWIWVSMVRRNEMEKTYRRFAKNVRYLRNRQFQNIYESYGAYKN